MLLMNPEAFARLAYTDGFSAMNFCTAESLYSPGIASFSTIMTTADAGRSRLNLTVAKRCVLANVLVSDAFTTYDMLYLNKGPGPGEEPGFNFRSESVP